MSISYKPLWKLLIDKEMNKKDFSTKVGISKSTIGKMNGNNYVALSVVDKICTYFDCEVSDVIQYDRTKDEL